VVNADGIQAADVHIKDGKILAVAPNIQVTFLTQTEFTALLQVKLARACLHQAFFELFA
jgi:dihydroorotase-like cyclic amidohydrolase